MFDDSFRIINDDFKLYLNSLIIIQFKLKNKTQANRKDHLFFNLFINFS